MHLNNLRSHPKSHHFFLLAALILIPMALLWSWNTLMPDIFGLTEIKFKHALALTILFVMVRGLTFRRRGHCHTASESKN